MKKDLLAMNDLCKDEIVSILELASDIKTNPSKYSTRLDNKTLIMLFQKNSTRTRASFEVGMTQLGGHAIFMDMKTTNFNKGSITDEIKCLSKYGDIIMARVYNHQELVDMANASSIPVINGLSDLEHPCQILADLMTIKEKKGNFRGIKVAYIGDGNNVCNSLIAGGTTLGINIAVATPKGYEPNKNIITTAGELLALTNIPLDAVKDADFIYTDTWISLGQEEETEEKIKEFYGFTVTKALLGKALFMHCLPAQRGYEVSGDVIDSDQSIIYDQAENRLHVQKAVLLKLME